MSVASLPNPNKQQVRLPDLEALDESALIANICRASLWEFVQEFWSVTSEEPLIKNWHMPVICSQLELIAERIFKRQKKLHDLLINISPGTTKSTITSVMFPAWPWTHCPWTQIICGSYAERLSEDLAVKSRNVILSEKYQKAFPEVRLTKDQSAKSYFVNTRGGWRFSGGVGGSVTGKHGHVIVIDDPVDPQEAMSIADLKTANDWLTNTIPQRKVSHDRTACIMIMQRLSDNDPSALWLDWKEKGIPIEHICLPVELTPNVKPKRLAKFYKDGLFDPVRFNPNVLKESKAKGAWTYQGQFLQDPVPPGGGLFKVGNLVSDYVNYLAPGWKLIRYWDKAATQDGGAFTVGVLMGKDPNGTYWVLDIIRGQWEPAERERRILQIANVDGRRIPIMVEQEPGSGGKESALATIKMLAGWRVGADRPTGDKMKRADPYAAQLNAGCVKLRKADWNRQYIEELRLFSPVATYKDQVDASSGAFAFLSGRKVKIGAFSLVDIIPYNV